MQGNTLADAGQASSTASAEPVVRRIYGRSELRRALPRATFLIPRLLPTRGLCCISGQPGAGKTFLTIKMACSLATGADFQGVAVPRLRVAYLAAEGQGGIDPRITAWERASRAAVADTHLGVLPFGLPLNTKQGLADTLSMLRDREQSTGPLGAIFIDNVSVTIAGSVNDDEAMGAYVRSALEIRDVTGAAVCIVHHPPKSTEHERGVGQSGAQWFAGSFRLFAGIDIGAVVVQRDGIVTVSSAKAKDDEAAPDMHFRLTPHDLSDELGHHDDGRPVTSCTLEPSEAPPQRAKPNASKKSPGPRKGDHRCAVEDWVWNMLVDHPRTAAELEAKLGNDPMSNGRKPSTVKNDVWRALNNGLAGRVRKRPEDDVWEPSNPLPD